MDFVDEGKQKALRIIKAYPVPIDLWEGSKIRKHHIKNGFGLKGKIGEEEHA